MGKNRYRESLIRIISNIVMHEIIEKHTNRQESIHFLSSEIIEYRSQAEKESANYNWNTEDKEYIEKKATKIVKEKLSSKYSDISYSEEEITQKLRELMNDIM